MELSTPNNSNQVHPLSEIVAEIAKTELERLNTPDATICWYDSDASESGEKLLKFDELSGEDQQAIIKGLSAYQNGGFVTIDRYKSQIEETTAV
jgi:hypothetical protein